MAYLTDEQRRHDLRRMKGIATGLLLLAVVVYVVATRIERGGGAGWAGYVAAAAEAAMVGALADWFAVTALFRHPLGLPIPHTALIRTRKDAFGASLESFVATNFLSERVVRDKLEAVGVAARIGRWLAEPAHARRVTAELATLARAAITVLRDDAVQSVLEQTVVRRLVDRPWGPPAGQLLDRVVAEGTHHRLVDLAVDEAYRWLLDNEERVFDIVTDQAPTWSPRFLDERVADRIYRELTRFVRDVQTDPKHRVRLALDDFLTGFAEDLRSDPHTMEQADQLKERLLAQSEVRTAMRSVLTAGRKLVLEAIEDPDSELRRRVAEGLAGLGRRLTTDDDLRDRVDGWISAAAGFAVTNYSGEVVSLISETVPRWDAGEASAKIELQVGRDLQFIRINGTVVGALAGLAIHTVTQLTL